MHERVVTKKTHCVYSVDIWHLKQQSSASLLSVPRVMSTQEHHHLADSFIFVKQSEP